MSDQVDFDRFTKDGQEGVEPEWTTCELGDLVETIGGGTPKTDIDDYWSGEIEWLTPSEVSDEKRIYVSDTERKITEEGLSNSSAKVLPPDSVLMTSRATVGVPAINTVPMSTNQGFIGIKPGEKIDNKFLFYWIKNNEKLILSRASGSTYPEISQTSFNNLEIELPLLSEQQKIGQILSSFDEKYQVNIKLMELLDEVAATLYSSKFESYDPYVDLKETELGKIPADFEVTEFGEICQTSGGGTPSTDVDEYWGGENRWLTPKEVTSLDAPVAYQTERTLTDEGLNNTSAKLMPKESILLTSRATVGEVVINKQPMATNQGFICIKSDENIPPHFLMNLVRSKKEEIKSRASGSTYDEISQTSFNSIPIALPPKEDRQQFEEQVKPMYDLIYERQQENDHLRELRDTLLPKLIEGDLRVNDINVRKKSVLDEV